ncbi:MAG: hypothetical protein IJ342_00255 [Muribaculaceae bacterium]|nr:hypothetical protein [Muribaculaceae bacterium]
MAKRGRKKRKEYVPTTITSKNTAQEIRSYFIDSLIEMNEYLKEREYVGQIRDQKKEKIRIDRIKARSNVCNIGLRALKDRQLDEYAKELAELKRGLLLNPDNDDVIVLSPDKVQEVEELEFKFEQMKAGEVSDNGD